MDLEAIRVAMKATQVNRKLGLRSLNQVCVGQGNDEDLEAEAGG